MEKVFKKVIRFHSSFISFSIVLGYLVEAEFFKRSYSIQNPVLKCWASKKWSPEFYPSRVRIKIYYFQAAFLKFIIIGVDCRAFFYFYSWIQIPRMISAKIGLYDTDSKHSSKKERRQIVHRSEVMDKNGNKQIDVPKTITNILWFFWVTCERKPGCTHNQVTDWVSERQTGSYRRY